VSKLRAIRWEMPKRPIPPVKQFGSAAAEERERRSGRVYSMVSHVLPERSGAVANAKDPHRIVFRREQGAVINAAVNRGVMDVKVDLTVISKGLFGMGFLRRLFVTSYGTKSCRNGKPFFEYLPGRKYQPARKIPATGSPALSIRVMLFLLPRLGKRPFCSGPRMGDRPPRRLLSLGCLSFRRAVVLVTKHIRFRER
jgi:hypothetical protein